MNFLRNSNRANLLLLVTVGLFIVSIIGRRLYPDNCYIRFGFYVFEAGLVGGCADWFAVTALFSKPLGFSYHTNLISRNRERLVVSIAESVQNELLSKDTLQKKIEDFSLLARVAFLLKKVENSNKIVDLLHNALNIFLNKQENILRVDVLESKLKVYLESLPLRNSVQKLLRWLVESGKEEKIYNYGFALLKQLLEQQNIHDFIYEYLQMYKKQKEEESFLVKIFSWVAEKADMLNIEEMTIAIHVGIIKAVEKMSEEDYPLRSIWREKLIDYADTLHDESAVLIFLERYRADILQKINLQSVLQQVKSFFLEDVIAAEEKKISIKPVHRKILAKTVKKYLDYFENNQGNFLDLEKYMKNILGTLLDREHYLIGDIVRMALESLSDDDLTAFIQSRAGDDLQWIRINGVVVGGVVGAVLYLFLNFIYEPLLLYVF